MIYAPTLASCWIDSSLVWLHWARFRGVGAQPTCVTICSGVGAGLNSQPANTVWSAVSDQTWLRDLEVVRDGHMVLSNIFVNGCFSFFVFFFFRNSRFACAKNRIIKRDCQLACPVHGGAYAAGYNLHKSESATNTTYLWEGDKTMTNTYSQRRGNWSELGFFLNVYYSCCFRVLEIERCCMFALGWRGNCSSIQGRETDQAHPSYSYIFSIGFSPLGGICFMLPSCGFCRGVCVCVRAGPIFMVWNYSSMMQVSVQARRIGNKQTSLKFCFVFRTYAIGKWVWYANVRPMEIHEKYYFSALFLA